MTEVTYQAEGPYVPGKGPGFTLVVFDDEGAIKEFATQQALAQLNVLYEEVGISLKRQNITVSRLDGNE